MILKVTCENGDYNFVSANFVAIVLDSDFKVSITLVVKTHFMSSNRVW